MSQTRNTPPDNLVRAIVFGDEIEVANIISSYPSERILMQTAKIYHRLLILEKSDRIQFDIHRMRLLAHIDNIGAREMLAARIQQKCGRTKADVSLVDLLKYTDQLIKLMKDYDFSFNQALAFKVLGDDFALAVKMGLSISIAPAVELSWEELNDASEKEYINKTYKPKIIPGLKEQQANKNYDDVDIATLITEASLCKTKQNMLDILGRFGDKLDKPPQNPKYKPLLRIIRGYYNELRNLGSKPQREYPQYAPAFFSSANMRHTRSGPSRLTPRLV